MVTDQELARSELVWIHGIQQLQSKTAIYLTSQISDLLFTKWQGHNVYVKHIRTDNSFGNREVPQIFTI